MATTEGTVDSTDDELRPAYELADLKGAVRGKYASRYQGSKRIVHLDPDVAAVFATEEAVNDALRLLIDLAQRKVQTANSDAD